MAKKTNNKTAKGGVPLICPDLKSDMKDSDENISESLKLVPIIFYVVLFLGFLAYVGNILADQLYFNAQRESANSEISNYESKTKAKDSELKKINDKAAKANIMNEWLSTIHHVQKIMLNVTNSLYSSLQNASIDSIKVYREEGSIEGLISLLILFKVPADSPIDRNSIGEMIYSKLANMSIGNGKNAKYTVIDEIWPEKTKKDVTIYSFYSKLELENKNK